MTAPFGIILNPPQRITTEHGPRIMQSGSPTAEFWNAWRSSKDGLKNQGYRVRKVENTYMVDYITEPPEEEPEYPPANPLLPLRNRQCLLPYQVQHTMFLTAATRRYGYFLDASDAGTGKTYCFFAVARELHMQPAIVCPKSAIIAWQRVAAYFGMEPYFVMNWEGCKAKKFAHGFWDKRTDEYYWKLGKTKILLGFDEAHKGKAEYSQNAKMIIAAKRQGIPSALLSATLAGNPRDMRAIGYMLGLHTLSDFHAWSKSLGCYQMEYNGQPRGWGCTDSVEAMGKIHRHLFPAKGSRMRIAELGDAFPETHISADIYPIAKAKEQNKSYADLVDKIATLKREKQEGWSSAAMVLNLRYRQQAELLKVDLITDLAKDGLENNLSILIYVNFTPTLLAYLENFPDASIIKGGQTTAERQYNIDRFQRDEARVIIANIQAGGVAVSLHDVTGKHARLSLINPTYSARDLKQVLGRPHRAGGKSVSFQKIIYSAGTVEEGICRTVARRLEAISSLNDGDLLERDLLGVLAKEKNE